MEFEILSTTEQDTQHESHVLDDQIPCEQGTHDEIPPEEQVMDTAPQPQEEVMIPQETITAEELLYGWDEWDEVTLGGM